MAVDMDVLCNTPGTICIRFCAKLFVGLGYFAKGRRTGGMKGCCFCGESLVQRAGLVTNPQSSCMLEQFLVSDCCGF